MDFKNTVIIMTTNLGTRDISKGVSVGFARSGESRGSYDRMKNKVQEELKQHFRPEFLNRVDDIIVFHQLEREEIFSIVDLMIAKVDDRLKDRDMAIELRPAAKDLLSKRGYDPVLGARPLRRTIQREIEDSLSEKILFGELRPGQIVIVDAEGERRDGQVHLHRRPQARRGARRARPGDGERAGHQQGQRVGSSSGSTGPQDGGGTASAVG